MKAESLAVIIGVDGEVRQVALTVNEVNAVRELISKMHGGSFKVLPGVIDTIEIEEIKQWEG